MFVAAFSLHCFNAVVWAIGRRGHPSDRETLTNSDRGPNWALGDLTGSLPNIKLW